MKFVRPNPVLDASLISSDVPETDHPAWVSGTSYTLGQRVIRTQTHRIYERLVAGAGTTAPELDTTNWLDIGPTNRWAMFDNKVGTVTSQADAITVTLAPGRVNSLALLNVNASTATVELVVDAVTVYSASVDLDSGVKVGNWYEYFYEPVYQQDTLVITDLVDAALLDIPAYGEGELTITLSRPGATVTCGVCVVGLLYDIGSTEFGASVSIRDYSRKDVDDFGNVIIVQRDYSRKLSAPVRVDADKVDPVTQNVARYRATPLVWLGSEVYGCTILYGFVTDWRLVISTPVVSDFSIEIEGLT